MNETDLTAVLSHLAKWQMVEAMWRYSRGVDRHDNAILESVFWPDAEINYTNVFSGDRAQFLGWANQHHEDLYLNHQHHTTAHIIDVEGEIASGEHYCIVFLQKKDGGVLLSSGRYLQQWERRDGEWRILVREFQPEVTVPAEGGTARLTSTPVSLRDMYASVATDVAVGGWAPFPPSGPSRWDTADLCYRQPLGGRADRQDLIWWSQPDKR